MKNQKKSGLQRVRENALIFPARIRQKQRYEAIFTVPTGAGVLVAAECEGCVGEEHLCFFLRAAVEHMDLNSFQQAYGEEGGTLYCPVLLRMRQKLRDPVGRRVYARRKALVEPVFGTLKNNAG
jgi:hypothetical protein